MAAGSAARDTFRSLGIRNYRLFLSGQFISQVGNWLTMIALTLLILDRTDSGIAVGLLAACQFGPMLLFGPWTGLLADRSDKRTLLLVVQTLAMAQSFALAALAVVHDVPVGWFFVIAAMGGLATAFDNPARRSFVVQLVPEEHVQNAVSLNSAIMTSSRIFGPALAGLLITTVGYGWAFLADGLTYLAVLAGLWMIDSSAVRRSPLVPRGKGQIREGLRYVAQVPVLWISLVMMAIVGTLTFNLSVVFPLLVKRAMGGSDADFTILYSVASVGSVVGALATARRRSSDVSNLVLAAGVFGGAMALLAAAPTLPFAYAAAVLVGGSSIAFMTTGGALLQLRATPTMQGRVVALHAMVFVGSTPIGGPILGWVSDWLGARIAVAVGAVAALGAAVWGATISRRTRPVTTSEAKRQVLPDAADVDVVTP